MNRKSLFVLMAAAMALPEAACAPSADSATDVIVLAYQPNLKKYDRKTVRLETIDDLVKVEGSVAKVVGGAEIDLDSNRPLKDGGGDVKLDVKDVDGVLVPADFHSLNMLTAYYNVEQAALFYERLNLNLADFGRRKIYYFPTMKQGGKELKDGAYYVSALEGIAVLPFDKFQKLPLGINLGVMGHEYTHAVIDYLVTGADPKSGINSPTYSSHEAMNVYSVLHEGIGDFMGTAIACHASGDYANCDLSFLSASVDGEEGRSLGGRNCLPSALGGDGMKREYTAFLNEQLNYAGGTVLASALWRAMSDIGTDEEAWTAVAMALVRALQGNDITGIRGLVDQEIKDGRQGEFAKTDADHLTMKAALNAIASGTDDAKLRRAICGAFLDRFLLKPADLPACVAGNAVSNGECSNLKDAPRDAAAVADADADEAADAEGGVR